MWRVRDLRLKYIWHYLECLRVYIPYYWDISENSWRVYGSLKLKFWKTPLVVKSVNQRSWENARTVGRPRLWALVFWLWGELPFSVSMSSTLLESKWARVTHRALSCLLSCESILVFQIRPLDSFCSQWKQNGRCRHVDSHFAKSMGWWMKA